MARLELKSMLSGRNGDVFWNLLSLSILGASGILINVVVGLGYGTAALGQFSLLLAAYLVFSQVAALGVHLSALKHVAEALRRPETLGVIIRAGALVVSISASLTAIAFALAGGWLERLFESPGLQGSIILAAPGLALFGGNKYSFGVLNGLSRLRVLAAVQAARPVAILIGLVVAAAVGLPSQKLGIVLTFSELVVAAATFPLLMEFKGEPRQSSFRRWVWRHLHFGAWSMPGHILIDLGTRIDILVLGVLLSERAVGIYSFAAVLAEGVAQISYVLRTVLNKDVVSCFVTGDRRRLFRLMRMAALIMVPGTALLSVMVVYLFVPVIRLSGLDAALMEGAKPLAIMLVGAVAASAVAPFGFALIQSGRPELHTLVVVLGLSLNLALTLVLVPRIGMDGAALAVAISLCATPLASIALAIVVRSRSAAERS